MAKIRSTNNLGLTLGNSVSTTGSTCSARVLIGDHIYAAFGGSIVSIDVSSPMLPVVDDILSLGYTPIVHLAAQGNYLYGIRYGTVSSSNRFFIVDISDPTNLTAAGFITNNLGFDQSFHVELVSSDRAVVMGIGYPTCHIINISNPASPSFIGNEPDSSNGDSYRHVRVGNYLIGTSDDSGGIAVLDLVTGMPFLSYAGESSTGTTDQTDIVYSNGVAYTIGNNNVYAYDLSDFSNPTYISNLASLGLEGYQTVSVGMYKQLAVIGDVLVASMVRDTLTGNGVAFIDISDPANMSIISTRTGPSTGPLNIQVHNGKVFLANYNELEMLNMANPASVTAIDSIALPNFCWQLVFSGNYGWALGGGQITSFEINL